MSCKGDEVGLVRPCVDLTGVIGQKWEVLQGLSKRSCSSLSAQTPRLNFSTHHRSTLRLHHGLKEGRLNLNAQELALLDRVRVRLQFPCGSLQIRSSSSVSSAHLVFACQCTPPVRESLMVALPAEASNTYHENQGPTRLSFSRCPPGYADLHRELHLPASLHLMYGSVHGYFPDPSTYGA